MTLRSTACRSSAAAVTSVPVTSGTQSDALIAAILTAPAATPPR